MNISYKQAQNIILSKAKAVKQPTLRKDFILSCVTDIYQSEPTGDEIPGGELNKIKCLLGNVLQQYIRTGIITETDTGLLQYSEKVETKAANRDIEIENILLTLTESKAYEKPDLLDAAFANYCKEHRIISIDSDERNAIRGDIGRVLGKLAEDGVIPQAEGKFGFKGIKVNRREANRQAIAAISDEEFETQTIKMLTAYFKTQGHENVRSKITGGANDEGVDGIITVCDKFLDNDDVIVQVKHRKNHNSFEPLKEIRGFAGVLAMKSKVYKGIYVTTAKYHSNVTEFLNNYDIKRLLLVDGEKWLDMAENCNYSVSEKPPFETSIPVKKNVTPVKATKKLPAIKKSASKSSATKKPAVAAKKTAVKRKPIKLKK